MINDSKVDLCLVSVHMAIAMPTSCALGISHGHTLFLFEYALCVRGYVTCMYTLYKTSPRSNRVKREFNGVKIKICYPLAIVSNPKLN